MNYQKMSKNKIYLSYIRRTRRTRLLEFCTRRTVQSDIPCDKLLKIFFLLLKFMNRKLEFIQILSSKIKYIFIHYFCNF